MIGFEWRCWCFCGFRTPCKMYDKHRWKREKNVCCKPFAAIGNWIYIAMGCDGDASTKYAHDLKCCDRFAVRWWNSDCKWISFAVIFLSVFYVLPETLRGQSHMCDTYHHVSLLCSNMCQKLSALALRQFPKQYKIEPLGMLPRFYDKFSFASFRVVPGKSTVNVNGKFLLLYFTSRDYDECLCVVLTLLIFICFFPPVREGKWSVKVKGSKKGLDVKLKR